MILLGVGEKLNLVRIWGIYEYVFVLRSFLYVIVFVFIEKFIDCNFIYLKSYVYMLYVKIFDGL